MRDGNIGMKHEAKIMIKIKRKLKMKLKGAVMANWLGRRIQDRNEDFKREFDSH